MKKSKKVLITVVIPTYNRQKTVKKAMKSVLSQSYSQWKLLIIDDASTDQTVNIIESFLPDKRVKLLQLKKNLGISKVMNKAIEHVDTPYFVQLDSDDWLEESTLKDFSKAIKKAKKNTALFYGNIKMVRKKKGRWRVVREIKHRHFEDKYDFLQYLTYMLHPRCYRTDAVLSVGGWDTDDPFQGRIMEDRRICLKLIEKYPFYWINKYLYFRRKHQTQLTSKEWVNKRNVMRKLVIGKCLEKWGNHYKPIYDYSRNGLIVIKKLKKI